MKWLAALPVRLRAVLFVVAVVHAIGLSWGLPASDAWDNDGVAPRDFLPGLAATYTPGHYYTYPPFHLALLALFTAPITIAAAVKAGSTRIPDVLEEIIQPSYMTAMSLVARVVALLMSIGICLAVAKIAEAIAPDERKKRSAEFAAATVGLGISFTYYAHTSNLDVPYLFWGSLAVLALVHGRLRWFAVLAALSVATKDQAYAMFVLLVPYAVWTFRRRPKELVIAGAIGLVLLLAIDGAITNPTGFRARLAFLGGSASQDFATYEKGAQSLLRIALDTCTELRAHYAAPVFFGGLYVLGAYEARRRPSAVVPLLVALSFTIFFNMTARRVEERFTLPQVVFLGAYAGIALARLVAATKLRWLVRGAVTAAFALAFYTCLELDANLLGDPRYDAEAFLAASAAPDDVVEVDGLNVYLPRIDTVVARFVRAGPTPPNRRSPVPGLEEIEAPYRDFHARNPRFIVVSECWVWRYLPDMLVSTPEGRVQPPTQLRDAADVDPSEFFHALFANALPYRLARESRFESRVFRRVKLHGSVGCPVYTFERAW